MDSDFVVPLVSVILAGTIAFASSYFVGARQRADERAWELAKRRTDAYASFLLRCSQWLQAINWSFEKRDAAQHRKPPESESREIENLHQMALEPLQLIRFYATDETFECARRVLTVCHEHQAAYFGGLLSDEVLIDNDRAWAEARDLFVSAARRETAHAFGNSPQPSSTFKAGSPRPPIASDHAGGVR